MVNLLFDKERHRLWFYGCKRDNDSVILGDYESKHEIIDFKKMSPVRAELVYVGINRLLLFSPDTLIVKNEEGNYAFLTTFVEGSNYDMRENIPEGDNGQMFYSDRGCFNYKQILLTHLSGKLPLFFLQSLDDKWSVIELSMNASRTPHVNRNPIKSGCDSLYDAARCIDCTLADILDTNEIFVDVLKDDPEQGHYRGNFEGKGIIL